MDPFSVIERLGSGKLLDELSQALVTTAEEVVATGKPGTVTLVLKVSNKGQGDPMVIVDEQISRSAPKKDPKGAFFFAVAGELHKEDPRQAKMTFREVDRETGEVRDVPYGTRVERAVE